MPALSAEAIQSLLDEHPDWALEGGRFVRRWDFPTFSQAIAFVNQVATLAEQAGHHPDIDIRYTEVCLSLISHDTGRVTQRDLKMVALLDTQFKKE